MMKNIVIIANFCRDFSEGDNGRFMYLCKELAKENKVEIITSDFIHDAKKHKDPLKIKWPFTITFLHEPGYSKNISIKRFMSHRVWGKNVGEYLEKLEKPDVIYCAMPSLTAAKNVADYCEKNGVKFIVDIQDLWPEAFKMALNVPVVSDVLFAPFNKIANYAYGKADAVCAVSKAYVKRALSVNNKGAKGHVAFLGTKLEIFDNNTTLEPMIRKPEGELWLGYCGSLSASYDIPCVIDALHILNEQGVKTPKFVVIGDGGKREEFSNYANKKNVDAEFVGRLPYDQMCAQLVQCDIVVNPIVKGSAASIINKHGDYASSGLPVLNTQESSEYRELVEEYNMGLNCNNGDAADLAKKCERLIADDNLRKTMGKNARRCAEERFDRKNSYLELLSCILE